MEKEQPVVFHVEPMAYNIFGIVCGVFAALGFLAVREDPGQWAFLAAPIAVYGGVFWWFWNYRVIIASDRIVISTISRRDRTVLLRDLAAVRQARSTALFANRETVILVKKSGDLVRLNTRIFPRPLKPILLGLSPVKDEKG